MLFILKASYLFSEYLELTTQLRKMWRALFRYERKIGTSKRMLSSSKLVIFFSEYLELTTQLRKMWRALFRYERKIGTSKEDAFSSSKLVIFFPNT